MFYEPPIDHELLAGLAYRGGPTVLPDLLATLAGAGGADARADLLAALAEGGGRGALPDLLAALAGAGGRGALPDLLAALARAGGAELLPEILAALAQAGGRGALPDLLAALARAGGAELLPEILAALAQAGGAELLPEILAALAQAGGAGERPSGLGLLADAGGLIEAQPDRLAELAQGGGRLCLLKVPVTELAALAVAGGFRSTYWHRVPVQVRVANSLMRRFEVPVVQPSVEVYVEDRSAEFLLEGYPEYEGHESTPPRYYRREVYDGRIATSSWAPDWDMAGHWWSGSRDWPAATGGSHVSFFGVYGDSDLPDEADPRWAGPGVPISFGSYDFPPGTLVRDKYDTESSVDTSGPDFVRRQGKGAFQGDPGDIDHSVTHGFLERRLIDEHTPCDALLEAVAGLEWETAEDNRYAQTDAEWMEDPEEPRRWQGRESQWIAAVSGLVIGTEYRFFWNRRGTLMEVFFTADAETWQHQEVVPCGMFDNGWGIESLASAEAEAARARAVYEAMTEAEKPEWEAQWATPQDGLRAWLAWSPPWMTSVWQDMWVAEESILRVEFLDLVPGQQYRLRYHRRGAVWPYYEPPWFEWHEVDFVADAAEKVIEIPVEWTRVGEIVTVAAFSAWTVEAVDLIGPGLAGLADEGGKVAIWTEHVPLALLPYVCFDFGPWQERWSCAFSCEVGAPMLVNEHDFEDLEEGVAGGRHLQWCVEDVGGSSVLDVEAPHAQDDFEGLPEGEVTTIPEKVMPRGGGWSVEEQFILSLEDE